MQQSVENYRYYLFNSGKYTDNKEPGNKYFELYPT